MKEVNQPKNIALSVSDTQRHDYREWRAVDQLLKAIDVASGDVCECLDNKLPFGDQFFINIAGQQIAFHLGGPQIEGLCKFIEQLAD